MGKRSDYELRDKDQYFTPYEAVIPLVPHLDKGTKFYEPCAGDGRLVDHLVSSSCFVKCAGYSDIDPDGARKVAAEKYGHIARNDVKQADALDITRFDLNGADTIITNPPWSRDKKSGYLLHEMIMHFSDMVPTWLLFDADWMHTKQAAPFLARCEKIVAIGRVKWIPNSTSTGKDNACWYLFSRPPNEGIPHTTVFYGR